MGVTNTQLMAFLQQMDARLAAIGQQVSGHDVAISLLEQRQVNHTKKWEKLGSRFWKVALIPIGAVILAILALILK